MTFISKSVSLILSLRLDIVMIPLVLRLTGKVTLKIPFLAKVTLYERDLWRYQANPIHKNIFDIHTKDPDTSPPEVVAYSTPAVSPRMLNQLSSRLSEMQD